MANMMGLSIHDDERSVAAGADAVQHAFRDNVHSALVHRNGGAVDDEIHSSFSDDQRLRSDERRDPE